MATQIIVGHWCSIKEEWWEGKCLSHDQGFKYYKACTKTNFVITEHSSTNYSHLGVSIRVY
jgi:hypothetical protein